MSAVKPTYLPSGEQVDSEIARLMEREYPVLISVTYRYRENCDRYLIEAHGQVRCTDLNAGEYMHLVKSAEAEIIRLQADVHWWQTHRAKYRRFACPAPRVTHDVRGQARLLALRVIWNRGWRTFGW